MVHHGSPWRCVSVPSVCLSVCLPSVLRLLLTVVMVGPLVLVPLFRSLYLALCECGGGGGGGYHSNPIVPNCPARQTR